MQALVENRCRLCGHKLHDGDTFCDSVCEEEYALLTCVKCGQFKEEGHTISKAEKHPEWDGRRICKACWEAI